jgi:cytosine/adenosine deaminase-related metal-dependent hydrolase
VDKHFKLLPVFLVVGVFTFGCATSDERSNDRKQVDSTKSLPSPVAMTQKTECVFSQAKDNSDEILLIGSYLPPDGIPKTGALVIRDGTLEEINDDVAASITNHPSAAVMKCSNTVISPGFVNAHEHLNYSYAPPDPLLQPIYDHRDEWRKGTVPGKPKLNDPPRKDDQLTLAWVELRHLMSGVTTVSSSGHGEGWIRNVDKSLAVQPDSFVADVNTLPFGEATSTFGGITCPPEVVLPEPGKSNGVPTTTPYIPHIGEGKNCLASLEIESYLDYVAAHPGRKYSLVHGIAATDDQLERMRDLNITLIWSPRSNLALYGKTLDPVAVINHGVELALATDWSPSGSYTILGELSCAGSYAQAKANRALTWQELWRMSTKGGADALGLGTKIGTIEKGKLADIVIIRGAAGGNFEKISALEVDDIVAVMIDGELRSADLRYMTGDSLPGCNNKIGNKFICADFSNLGYSFAALIQAGSNYIQPFSTDFQAKCSF